MAYVLSRGCSEVSIATSSALQNALDILESFTPEGPGKPGSRLPNKAKTDPIGPAGSSMALVVASQEAPVTFTQSGLSLFWETV